MENICSLLTAVLSMSGLFEFETYIINIFANYLEPFGRRVFAFNSYDRNHDLIIESLWKGVLRLISKISLYP